MNPFHKNLRFPQSLIQPPVFLRFSHLAIGLIAIAPFIIDFLNHLFKQLYICIYVCVCVSMYVCMCDLV